MFSQSDHMSLGKIVSILPVDCFGPLKYLIDGFCMRATDFVDSLTFLLAPW